MARFRKRPEEIEAVRWTGDNLDELHTVFGATGLEVDSSGRLRITGVVGEEMYATKGDWIIRDAPGAFSRVKPEVMAATYEPAPAGASGSSSGGVGLNISTSVR